LEMAETLLHDHSRCAICGIPQYIVAKLYRRGYGWLQGVKDSNRHLSCDHINPNGSSDPENLRPLCHGCNWKKRENQLTDEEVLGWARARWPRMFNNSRRKLWWLNTHFENGLAVGGTLFRSEHAEKAERRIRGEES
jgi:hypothetical protein